MNQLLRTIPVLCLLCSFAVSAETMYVTDQLRLNLFEKPNSQGATLKSVQSGTALVVLEREPGFARVRTPDGITGWVKSAYLVVDKPATLVVSSTMAQMEQMQKQYNLMRKQLEQAKVQAATSSKEAQDVRATLQSEQKGFQEMKTKTQELQRLINNFGSSVPLSVFSGGVILALLLGFGGGWFWLDYRIRKTHGGFRIY